MSADNYYVIFREGDTYYPVMGFASNEGPPELEDRHRERGVKFKNLSEAELYCQNQYAEYGYELDSSVGTGPRCPVCKSLYDDVMTECYQMPPNESGDNGWCWLQRLKWSE